MHSVSMLVAVLWPAAAPGVQEAPLPVLKATRPVVSVREGETLRRDAWRLAPELEPDVYEAEVQDGKPIEVAFLTDVDSIRFLVEEGAQHDFVIQHGDDRCLTRIVGVRAVPAAVFDATYRAANGGRISIEVPEVYELVNVALAMTPTGLADRDLVYHDSDYHAAVRAWFEPHREHPVLAALDAALKRGPGYASLKMNAYSFEFDREGRIVPSQVYDRTAFSGERRNTLRPFLGGLQEFADASRFREFYARNRTTYAEQIAFYRDAADVEGMLAWLRRNFPGSSGYDAHRILFSPLVAHSQSATWLESQGFEELQAHVNYPYPEDVRRRAKGAALSSSAETILRGAIVFTELNHGFVNPETDRYAERVAQATRRREHWVDPARGPGYYAGVSAFNEYLNWGLVSLRVTDVAPAEDQPLLVRIVEEWVTARGFLRFAAFDAFLVDLYRRREPGCTVADLYPRIIAWFAEQDG